MIRLLLLPPSNKRWAGTVPRRLVPLSGLAVRPVDRTVYPQDRMGRFENSPRRSVQKISVDENDFSYYNNLKWNYCRFVIFLLLPNVSILPGRLNY
jgi:hypothetical protein